jgi:hypothetical protein
VIDVTGEVDLRVEAQDIANVLIGRHGPHSRREESFVKSNELGLKAPARRLRSTALREIGRSVDHQTAGLWKLSPELSAGDA